MSWFLSRPEKCGFVFSGEAGSWLPWGWLQPPWNALLIGKACYLSFTQCTSWHELETVQDKKKTPCQLGILKEAGILGRRWTGSGF